jgi:hypothetical protein
MPEPPALSRRPPPAVFAIVSALYLLFIMFMLPIFREDVFIRRRTLTLPEIAILIGFLIVFLFTLISVLWLAVRSLGKKPHPGAPRLALLGALCLILMAAVKVMVDEIGREIALGWETTGEWIILYILLAAQLIYHLLVWRLLRRGQV